MLLLIFLAALSACKADAITVTSKKLNFDHAPADNPLRGFVPYENAYNLSNFPHSLEFSYFSLKELMTGMDEFTWEPLDKKLRQSELRGVQLNFRVYLEYPEDSARELGVPDFLADTSISADNLPIYEDDALLNALKSFIAALGMRYDQHDAIGFISVGLLGKWGEWHTYPEDERMASKAVQETVMNAYKAAFPTKKLVLRYPAGPSDSAIADNANEPFGYHDDSFGSTTLYNASMHWSFLTKMTVAGATEKWKKFPIGGEVFPKLSDTLFTQSYTGQNFTKCVEDTHVSWLREEGMLRYKAEVDDKRREAAIKAVSKMGYALYVSKAEKEVVGPGSAVISLTVENHGVAPFYYDWPVLVHTSKDSEPLTQANWKLTNILPGESIIWVATVPEATVYWISVPNPMTNGKALRFSNKEQDGDVLRIEFD